MKKLIIPLILILTLAMAGCGSSDEEAYTPLEYQDNQIITAEYDSNLAAECSNGTFVGQESDGVISYKGVPYAKQPVGELRWKAPQYSDDSNNVYEAYYYGKAPIQTEWPSETGSYYEQGEDCLYLNVWTADNDYRNKPVMVFIHGGSYGWGGTTDPLYDGHNFVAAHDDVILVTVGYRTGIMGFMDFDSVEGGEAFKESGNLGLLDQAAALKWINQNITAFGGDPGNVTEFGESADVDMIIGTNADETRYWIQEMALTVPVLPGDFTYGMLMPVMFDSNVKAMSDSDKAYVDAFMADQGGENTWTISEFYNELIFRIPAIAMADAHSRNGGSVYMYYWEYPSAIGNMGACHAVELAYVFNNLDL